MEGKITRRGLLLASTLAVLTDRVRIPASADELVPTSGLDHERFMRLAIIAGQQVPACPFGAVIVNVKTNKVIAEGWNRTGTKNPIWHGEMSAINNCPDVDTGFKWNEVCVYTTGEPCPMCMSAIIWAGMPLVVYGSSIPFLDEQGFGQIKFRAQDIIEASQHKPRIIGGILEKECNQLFIDSNKSKKVP